MLKLSKQPEEVKKLPLQGGACLYIRTPMTSLTQNIVAARARARMDELKHAPDIIKKAGGKVLDLADILDDVTYNAYFNYYFTVELAKLSIVKWDGIGDADGKAIDVSDEHVEQLISGDDIIADKILHFILANKVLEYTEGKN